MTDKTVKLPELAEIEKALRCLYLEAHRSVISGPWNTMLLIRRAQRIIDDMRMLVGEIADLQAKLAQGEAELADWHCGRRGLATTATAATPQSGDTPERKEG